MRMVANKQKRRQRERARHASQQSVFYVGIVAILGNQLVGQSLSALCASSLEYVSAISSLHSLSEAVLLLSLTLFRLVSSEHRFAPPLD